MVMFDDTTVEKVKEAYDKFMLLIDADSRNVKLKKMYENFSDELSTAPASAKHHYHNAFPGGYICHVVHVAEIAVKMSKLYLEVNGDVDYTKQELVFAALHHDLGKLGMEDTPYYLEQDSDWHRKRGEVFKHNEAIQYMKVADRAIFTLQKYGIEITNKEFLAIKLADGLYDDSNKSYLVNHGVFPMKTNLPYIIHWADHMATSAERDSVRF
jgi:hypothetical protein